MSGLWQHIREQQVAPTAVVVGTLTATVILDVTGFRAVVSSLDGSFVTSGSFILPVIGAYDTVITHLTGPSRSVTVSAGSVSHPTESNPYSVDSGGVVAVTITTTAVNAVVTVN